MATSGMDPGKWKGSDWITAIGTGLQGIFGGSSERELTPEELAIMKERMKYARWASYQIPGLEKQMKAPVDMGQINAAAPMISRAILPQIKKMMTTMGSRFGVRSPITAGTVGNMASSTLAQGASNLYGDALRDKWRKLGMIYQGNVGLTKI